MSGCRCCPGVGPSGQVQRCYFAESGVPAPFRTINAGFEEPFLPATAGQQGGPPGGNWWTVPEGLVPGWETDDPSTIIEMWRTPAVGGHVAYEGAQMVEINYAQATRLWQSLDVPAGPMTVVWEWAHRARSGTGPNRAQMLLGDVTTDWSTTHDIVSDVTAAANSDWQFYTGTWQKPAGVTQITVSLRSLLPAGGIGNIVDAVALKSFVRQAALTVCADATEEWRDTVTGELVDPALLTECP